MATPMSSRPLPVLLIAFAALTALAGSARAEQDGDRAGLSDEARQMAQWSAEDYQLLRDAWLHTAGPSSYEYRWVETTDLKQARVLRLQRWGVGTRVGAELRKAGSLVDVPPALRLPLDQLLSDGRRSPVVAIQKGGQTWWTIVELVHRAPVAAPQSLTEFKRKAVHWVADGKLPAPEALRSDPLERARSAYWRATTPELVRQVPAELSPQVRFGNGMTPLTQAILSARFEVAQALLARGADPALCGVWGCALHAAAWIKDPQQSQQAVELLLAAGAKPDLIDPAFDVSASTPLVEALRAHKTGSAELLLRAGASPDGMAGARFVPLAVALAMGDRTQAEKLLKLGASPLPWRDRALDDLGGRTTLTMAAQEAKNPELSSWVEQLVADAAAASPRYRWSAHIEQDGKRLPLADGATLNLRAAPFKLVLTLPADSDASLAVAASRSPALAAQVRSIEKRNGLFSFSSSSALAAPPDPDSYELFLYATEAKEGARPDWHWGGFMNLARAEGPNDRQDFHELRESKREYVREFRAVADIFEDDRRPETHPVSELKGQRLTLALGAILPIEHFGYQRLVTPRVVSLSFR